jgi:hypothetical protein
MLLTEVFWWLHGRSVSLIFKELFIFFETLTHTISFPTILFANYPQGEFDNQAVTKRSGNEDGSHGSICCAQLPEGRFQVNLS